MANRRPTSLNAAFWLGLLALTCVMALSSLSAATPSTGEYVPRHVIVELESEPLAHRFGPGLHDEQRRKRATLNEESVELHATDRYARLVVENDEAREHLNKLEGERATFLDHLADALALPKDERDDAAEGGVRQLVARSYDHEGQQVEAVFSTAFHGLGLRIPEQYQGQPQTFVRLLRNLPHVRAASLERRVVPQLFSSGAVINLDAAYAAESIGSIANAGKGIKIASIDGGVYAAAPMFNGTGYAYPPGWTNAKKGDASNCNGKVIVSKVFSAEPKVPSNPGLDDEEPHGTFSASIAGGVVVNATRASVTKQIHGVAPQAWIMAYRRLGYEIQTIQALEAVIHDGADVVINSWAIPPYNYDDGPYSPIDRALISTARAGVFVAMAASNEGPFLSTVVHASDDYITVGSITKESYLDTSADQIVDVQPYMVSNFSSRGPSVLRTLKPDIVAPGDNIMAQGYGPDPAKTSAEFGVNSGTSFATPMVAGAGALMKQIHPGWTPKQVKAAFMASAKWKGVTSGETGLAAQPLDMGAGALNLAGAIDPGALLDPPSLSFGYMAMGQQKTIQVTVSSVANTSQTYTVTSVFTGNGSASDYSTPVTGIMYSPSTITLAPHETAQISVTFDSSTSGIDIGDNQGFIVLTSGTYEVHMPLWARVLSPASSSVLIINVMGSTSSASTILDLYKSTLTTLGYDSTVVEAVATPLTRDDLWFISTYPLVFVLSGDNGVGGATPEEIPQMTQEVLREYVVMGGRLFLSGAMAPVLARTYINGNPDTNLINFLVNSTLNSQTCPSDAVLPTVSFSGLADVKAFNNLSFTLLDTPSSRCAHDIYAATTDNKLFPRELLVFMFTKGPKVYVAGRRAQPTKAYQGRRFEFATVTSSLSLEMIPEASRVPFVAAVIGYLTEDVNINLNVSSTDSAIAQFSISLSSSLSDSLTSHVAAPASLVPSYIISFGDSTSKTITGRAEAEASVVTHCYRTTGVYNVTVEAVSAFGTGAIYTQQVPAVATDACGSASLRAPLAFVLEWLFTLL